MDMNDREKKDGNRADADGARRDADAAFRKATELMDAAGELLAQAVNAVRPAGAPEVCGAPWACQHGDNNISWETAGWLVVFAPDPREATYLACWSQEPGGSWHLFRDGRRTFWDGISEDPDGRIVEQAGWPDPAELQGLREKAALAWIDGTGARADAATAAAG